MALHWQILIALCLAALAGLTLGEQSWFLESCRFVATMFLNALKMLIIPLILSAMVAALLGMPESASLGRMGARTAALFLVTTLMAVLTGLTMVNLIAPGVIGGVPAAGVLGLMADSSEVQARIEGRGGSDFAEVFLRMLPPNLIADAAKGETLGLIVFAILFGYFASRLPSGLASSQRQFWNGFYEIMIGMTELVMRFAPIGVFALVARTMAGISWDAVSALMLFVLCVLGGLVLQILLWLPLLLRALAGVSSWRHLVAMSPVLLTAFSTSSSAATLPVTMETVRERAGVSANVAGLVLPLGATVNMNGTALYECVAAMFIAQAYGVELSLTQQFVVVALALVTSVGVAGVPSASLVAITVILSAIGLPLEGIGLILAVDRVLDMLRTAVNVYSDTVVSVIVARLQREPDIYGLPAFNPLNRDG